MRSCNHVTAVPRDMAECSGEVPEQTDTHTLNVKLPRVTFHEPWLSHVTIIQLTREWPAWPATHDPVPDHGMSRSRLLTNHDEFTTIAYTVSLVVYTLYTAIFTSWTRWTVLWFFFNLTPYTFTPHLIMDFFYNNDPWPTWPIQICWPIWPMTHHDPLTHCLLCWWVFTVNQQ